MAVLVTWKPLRMAIRDDSGMDSEFRVRVHWQVGGRPGVTWPGDSESDSESDPEASSLPVAPPVTE